MSSDTTHAERSSGAGGFGRRFLANAPQAVEQLRTLLTFDIGDQTIAADVTDVREILDSQSISPLPNATANLIGMIDIRGEGVAVMDLSMPLGLERGQSSSEERIIVLDMSDEDIPAIAIAADRVRKVVELAALAIDPVPAVPGTWRAGAMQGVARIDGRLVYLVNLRVALGLMAGAESTQPAGAALPGPFDFD